MDLLTTSPHGAQIVGLVCEHPDGVGNSLFAVVNDDRPPKQIVMTGEELTSLAKQWLAFTAVKETNPTRHRRRKQGTCKPLPKSRVT